MINEKQLLQELNTIVSAIPEVESIMMDEPVTFIRYYYEQEDVLETIKDQLFDYYPPTGARKSEAGLLIERLQLMMKERERGLLTFCDWGDPVAIVMEKAEILVRLKKELSLVFA